jgi:membrane protease YdiL (CAAX protease family)
MATSTTGLTQTHPRPRTSRPVHALRRPVAGSLGALAVFVVLAYAISWASTFPLAAAGEVIDKGRGWPTHAPALLGPALAALAVTAWLSGRAGLADLLSRMARWRMPFRWWAAALSPLAFLVIALPVAAVAGELPSWSEFGRYSGLPALGVVPVALLAILINGFGEETGWRGYALPLLQRRYGPLAAALLVTPIWAGWHLPYFFTLATYRDFSTPAYVGFVFGLACGSIVLTWLYNGTGESILACAVWHGLFNLTTATVAGSGTIAAVTSTLVIVQALVLVGLELRARGRGQASVLGRSARGTETLGAAVAS